MSNTLKATKLDFSLVKPYIKVIGFTMLMTIPFRCAPRHQRNMKPGTSNAASRNLLECT